MSTATVDKPDIQMTQDWCMLQKLAFKSGHINTSKGPLLHIGPDPMNYSDEAFMAGVAIPLDGDPDLKALPQQLAAMQDYMTQKGIKNVQANVVYPNGTYGLTGSYLLENGRLDGGKDLNHFAQDQIIRANTPSASPVPKQPAHKM